MAVTIQKVLSRNLKRIRKERGLTQERSADLIQTSLRHFQSIEAMQKWPTPEMIRKIAKGLKVKQTDLFSP